MLAVLALLGIPTIAALTTGSALSLAVAWTQVGSLAIQAASIAGQVQLPVLPAPRHGTKYNSRMSVHAEVQGGPLGWGRSPVHMR
jgi:hypothetical protein